MNIAALNGHAVPKPIVQMLTRLIRRTRWLIAVKGACAVLATAVGMFLLVMGIDATVTLFSLWTRWALTLSAYAATAVVALVFLVRPLAHSFTLAGIARAIETHHPELHESISSSVELLTSSDAPELRGSDQLIAALVVQATDSARAIQPRREITLRAARPFLVAAATVGVVFIGLFLAWPDTATFLFTRASAPFINLPNLRARDLAVKPGDKVIAEGDRLEVEVTVPSRAVRSASFRRSGARGGERSEPMTLLNPAEAGRLFALTCPPAAQSFRYRIHAGDALSRYYSIIVVARPALERLIVRYDHPSYTQWSPTTDAEGEGNVRALAGTTVTITAKTNKPIAKAEFLINGQPLPTARIGLVTEGADAPGCRVAFELTPDLAGHWTLSFADEHGFTGSTPEHAIEIQPDNPPIANIIAPEAKSLRLPPTARVPISYTAEDDVGLSRTELLVEIDGKSRPPAAIPLGGTGKKPVQAKVGETALDLATLSLRGAKYVTFQLRAADSLPPKLKGPQHGLSAICRIELDVRAPSYAAAQVMDQEKRIKETLEKVKHDLKKAKGESEKVQRDLATAKGQERPENKEVDRMRKDLANADAGARRAAQDMEAGAFQGLAEKAKELADEHIAKAENVAGQIKLPEERPERATLAREADRLIDRSLKAVDELLQQIEPVADAVRKAAELDELAKREADLTKARLAMDDAKANPDAAKPTVAPDDWKKAQDALAKELGNMLKDTPGAPRAAMEMDQKAAANLANEARQMAKEQQALAADAKALDKLQQVDKALAGLAQEQKKLADDAAANPAAKDQAPPMGKAAENIEANRLDAAVAQQAAAENALKERADQLAKGQAPNPQAANPDQPPAKGQEGAPKAGDAPQAQPAGDQAPKAGDQAKGQPAGDQAPKAGDQAKGQPAGDQAPKAGDAPQAQPAGDQAPKAGDQAKGQPAGDQAPKAGDAPQPNAAQANPQQAQQVGDMARRQGELREKTEALRTERKEVAGALEQGQMDRLKAEQAEVAHDAAALAQQVAQDAPQPDKLPDQAAAAAQDAAKALDNNQVPKAADNATKAGNQLGDLAKRMEAAAAQPFAPQQPNADQGAPKGDENPNPPAADQGAPKAGDDAKPAGADQGAPKAGDTAKPAGADQGAPKAGDDAKPAGADQGAPKAGDDAKPAGADQGAPKAGENAQGQGKGAPDAGGKGNPEGPPPGQPANPQQAAQLAQKAADLAERQQQLAREMQALAKGDPLGQAAAEQAALAERAGDLADAAKAMQQQGEQAGFPAPAQDQAGEAAAQLGNAEKQAEAAAGQLAQSAGEKPGQPAPGQPGQGQPAPGQPAPGAQPGQGAPTPSSAQGSQQASADALNAAAAALDALGKTLGEAAAKAPEAAPGDATNPGDMASAHQSANQASQSQSAMSAAQAAGKLGEMASQSASQAQAMGGSLKKDPFSQAKGAPKKGTGEQETVLSEAKLKELGIKLSDWARLPGELRDQILQAAQDAGPEEYRPLIKRYFQEIARRGGEKAEATRPPEKK